MQEERLTKTINVRVKEKDLEAVDYVAAVFGKTRSEYLRDFAIRITEQIAAINQDKI